MTRIGGSEKGDNLARQALRVQKSETLEPVEGQDGNHWLHQSVRNGTGETWRRTDIIEIGTDSSEGQALEIQN